MNTIALCVSLFIEVNKEPNKNGVGPDLVHRPLFVCLRRPGMKSLKSNFKKGHDVILACLLMHHCGPTLLLIIVAAYFLFPLLSHIKVSVYKRTYITPVHLKSCEASKQNRKQKKHIDKMDDHKL